MEGTKLLDDKYTYGVLNVLVFVRAVAAAVSSAGAIFTKNKALAAGTGILLTIDSAE
jgi:hypothetical protein